MIARPGGARRMILLALGLGIAIFTSGCPDSQNADDKTIYLSGNGMVKSLDPALAEDEASRNMTAAFYDTLLQYEYTDRRPYQLEPSMLAQMPECSPDRTVYRFTLRDDLYFAPDACFGRNADKAARKITSADVAYSFLRIADAKTASSVFWIFRGKIRGIDRFRSLSGAVRSERERQALYDRGIEGIQILDDLRFLVRLNRPDTGFLYLLAIPYSGIVSRRAVEFYGDKLGEHPVGSGPFVMKKHRKDYSIELAANPEYREEFFVSDGKSRRLPLAKRIVCYTIRQSLSAWLLFLQGKLDLNVLDKDNSDLAANADGTLIPALRDRGIRLVRFPELSVRYLGFNHAEGGVFKHNRKLRQAIALAFDRRRIMEYFNYRMVYAEGAIPPGVAGHDPEFRNPYGQRDLVKARALLAEAGYPGGIDPATGKPLVLTFDQPGDGMVNRQFAEMLGNDLAEIGIEVVPVLNNRARFFEKQRQGTLQLFRLSWTGDYPDAENFLQLFYSGNRDSCNRTGFSDPKFDAMFEKALSLPSGAERTELYRKMNVMLAGELPCIFEGHPVYLQLVHAHLRNYLAHDFAFNYYKYLEVDSERRARAVKNFRPLSMTELSGR
ncbi:MAG: ABC transporter substrate-binding protein [Victivallaceae bacterium]|nr:ABC transporter substrate-binding protein [Victivallaceae bacterium]